MASNDRFSSLLHGGEGNSGGGNDSGLSTNIHGDYNWLMGMLNGDEPDPALTGGGAPVERFAAPMRLITFDGVDEAGDPLIDPSTGRQQPQLLVRAQHGLHAEFDASTEDPILHIHDDGMYLGDVPFVGDAVIDGSLLVDGTLEATGAVTFGDDLDVAGDLRVAGTAIISTDLSVTGNTNLTGTLAVGGNVTLGNAITDTVLVNGVLTVSGAATLNGNTTIGNANTDAHTVIGVTIFRNFLNTLAQLYVDAGNNRVIVGAANALASDTTPCLQVQGRVYIAPESANDLALELRRSAASATPAIRMGVTSAGELVIKDESDVVIAKFDGATYAMDVTGDARVSDDFVAGARAVVGSTTWSGAEEFRVVGQTRLEGALEVTTGGVVVTGLTRTSTIEIDGTNSCITLSGTTQTQATIGINGGAAALTANPRTYIKAVVAGANVIIPCYNA
jgi:hypothetical protein